MITSVPDTFKIFMLWCCDIEFKRSYEVNAKNLPIFFTNTNSASKSLAEFQSYSLRIFLRTRFSC
jgi:hypothetical protein